MNDGKDMNGARDRKIIDHQDEPISGALLRQERASCPRGADPEHSAPLLLELRQTALLEGNPNGAIWPKYCPNGQTIAALKTGVVAGRVMARRDALL
jgi:hypothetical protein